MWSDFIVTHAVKWNGTKPAAMKSHWHQLRSLTKPGWKPVATAADGDGRPQGGTSPVPPERSRAGPLGGDSTETKGMILFCWNLHKELHLKKIIRTKANVWHLKEDVPGGALRIFPTDALKWGLYEQ